MPDTMTRLSAPCPQRSHEDTFCCPCLAPGSGLVPVQQPCHCSALGHRSQEGAKWRKAPSRDIPQKTCTVQRNGTTYPRHLPASPRRQAQPQFLRTAPTIAQALVIQRPTPVAAQRLLSRLQALALNYGAVVCARCHPPADAALVAAWAGEA
jgi:hypothetical protein